MDTEEAGRVIDDRIKKQIDARLVPVTGMIIGLELAIAHIFSTLHHQGVLSRKDAIQSIDKTISGNAPHLPPAAAMTLRHIRGMLEGIDENTPEALRARFQVILGDLSEKPPEDTD